MTDFFIILLLTSSWAIIYIILRVSYRFAAFFLLDLPIYLRVGKWRINTGIYSLRRRILKSVAVTDSDEIDEKVTLIDNKIANLQKQVINKISKTSRITKFLRSLFSDRDFRNYLIMALNKSEKILESDQSMIKYYSNDPEYKTIRNLMIQYNDNISEKDKKIFSEQNDLSPKQNASLSLD